MKDKFTIGLVWHNCKTYPPKERYNDCLYVTDGNRIMQMEYHSEYGWIDTTSKLCISERYLHLYDCRQLHTNSHCIFP